MEVRLIDRLQMSLLRHGCSYLTADASSKEATISSQVQRNLMIVRNYPKIRSTESVGCFSVISKSI